MSSFALLATCGGIFTAVLCFAFYMVYKYGRITVLKEQADKNLSAKGESDDRREEIRTLSQPDLDGRTSPWVRDNE